MHWATLCWRISSESRSFPGRLEDPQLRSCWAGRCLISHQYLFRFRYTKHFRYPSRLEFCRKEETTLEFHQRFHQAHRYCFYLHRLEGFVTLHLFYFGTSEQSWGTKAKIWRRRQSLHRCVKLEAVEGARPGMRDHTMEFLRGSGEAEREASHCSRENLDSHCNAQVWHGNSVLGSLEMRLAGQRQLRLSLQR